MASLTIYKFQSIEVRALISPDVNSQQSVTLMGEDNLTVSFESPVPIPFKIGDYCTFIGKTYKLNSRPKRTRLSDRRIQYTLILESEMYDLSSINFLFLNADNIFTEPVFPLRGRLQDFGDLLIYNIRRDFPLGGWQLGNVEETDYITLEFSAQNCLQVLKDLADAFKTEYLIEGRTIHLYQRSQASGLIFEQGQNNALLTLTEEDQTAQNIITRLYAFGSSKNITPDYRGGAQRLRMGSVDFIDKNVGIYGVKEGIILFDGTNGNPEIFPHRTGTITAVDDPMNFRDASIDFDVNDFLVPGVSAQIVFNTGLLSGYTFDISAFDNSTKMFTVLKNTDETAIDVPSASYTPVIGDTYVLVNIEMPPSYQAQAESDLRTAAMNYLDKKGIPPPVYSGNCNVKYFKENNVNLILASNVLIKDSGLGININTRITSYTRKINNIFDYGITLSDTVNPKSILVKILNGL